MDKLKQTRITVSKSELTLIRKMHGTAQADCPNCQARVEMATPEQVVTLTGIHSRVIYGLVERGLLHFIETAEGHLLICLDSLRAAQEGSLQKAKEIETPARPILPSAGDEE